LPSINTKSSEFVETYSSVAETARMKLEHDKKQNELLRKEVNLKIDMAVHLNRMIVNESNK
jgi:hypothetical protein